MESFLNLSFILKKKKKSRKGSHCIIYLKIVIKHFEEPNYSEFLKQYESGNLLLAGELGSGGSVNDHNSQTTHRKDCHRLANKYFQGKSIAMLTRTYLKHSFSWTLLHLWSNNMDAE